MVRYPLAALLKFGEKHFYHQVVNGGEKEPVL
jgi:hypothetical protein